MLMVAGVCDVCRILENDLGVKLIRYCSMCDAWICEEDNNRWDRRITAALKRKLESGYRGDPDYEKNFALKVGV